MRSILPWGKSCFTQTTPGAQLSMNHGSVAGSQQIKRATWACVHVKPFMAGSGVPALAASLGRPSGQLRSCHGSAKFASRSGAAIHILNKGPYRQEQEVANPVPVPRLTCFFAAAAARSRSSAKPANYCPRQPVFSTKSDRNLRHGRDQLRRKQQHPQILQSNLRGEHINAHAHPHARTHARARNLKHLETRLFRGTPVDPAYLRHGRGQLRGNRSLVVISGKSGQESVLSVRKWSVSAPPRALFCRLGVHFFSAGEGFKSRKLRGSASEAYRKKIERVNHPALSYGRRSVFCFRLQPENSTVAEALGMQPFPLPPPPSRLSLPRGSQYQASKREESLGCRETKG